jgi:hypothetical protein
MPKAEQALAATTVLINSTLSEAAEECQALPIGGRPYVEAVLPWRAVLQSFLAGIILTLTTLWYFGFLRCGRQEKKEHAVVAEVHASGRSTHGFSPCMIQHAVYGWNVKIHGAQRRAGRRRVNSDERVEPP